MNYIASCLFTTCQDPIRPIIWKDNIHIMNAWFRSGVEVCRQSEDLHLLVFHDDLPANFLEEYASEYLTFVKVDACGPYSPHDYRWFVYKSFVESNFEELDSIFFTDISDVLIKNNPFVSMDSKVLYCGDEQQTWNNDWVGVRNYYFLENIADYGEIFYLNKDNTFLNAGLLGGHKGIVLPFLEQMTEILALTLDKPYDSTDMLLFNYIMYKRFKNVQHGAPVNSLFWKNEVDRNDVWFIHK